LTPEQISKDILIYIETEIRKLEIENHAAVVVEKF